MPLFQSLGAKRVLLWYILIVSIAVVPLSWSVITGCQMILIGASGDSRNEMKGFGLFSNAIYDEEDESFLGCVNYSQYLTEETDDIFFLLARIFGYCLGGFVTLATLICLLVQCFSKHGKSCLWTTMRCCYALAFAFQGSLAMLWWTNVCDSLEGEETRCGIGQDAIISMFNLALLFGMVVATFSSFPPRNPVFRCWHVSSVHYDTELDTDDDNSNKNKVVVDIEGQPQLQNHRYCDESVSLFTGYRATPRASEKPTTTRHLQVEHDASVSEMSKVEADADDETTQAAPGQFSIQQEKDTAQRNFFNRQMQGRKANADPQGAVQSAIRRRDPPIANYYLTQKSIFNNFRLPHSNTMDTTASTVNEEPAPKKRVWKYKQALEAKEKAEKERKTAEEEETKEEEEIIQPAMSANDHESVVSRNLTSAPSEISTSDETAVSVLNFLASTVVLGKNGVRISEERAGKAIKIVDFYAAPGQEGSERPAPDDSDIIKVRTEYAPEGRKTVKEECHAGGARTVTTMVDAYSINA